MPQIPIYPPWRARQHPHPASNRYYVEDARGTMIAGSLEPGIARLIATLPDVLAARDDLVDAVTGVLHGADQHGGELDDTSRRMLIDALPQGTTW